MNSLTAQKTTPLTGHADGSRALSRYVDVDDDLKKNVIENINK